MNRYDEDPQIRKDIFEWLELQGVRYNVGVFSRAFLMSAYMFHGTQIPLMDSVRGIWNPRALRSTLSITSTINGPYDDDLTGDVIKYMYEGTSAGPIAGGRNTKLRTAFDNKDPLIYFQEVEKRLFLPRYPAFIVEDNPIEGFVRVALEETEEPINDPIDLANEQQRYAKRTVLYRLHQRNFRYRILKAYKNFCAICELRRTELLDAAHIIPDATLEGSPEVSNGLALCKIHHAAYDSNLIGIDGDYRVHVKHDLLEEPPSPVIQHGIQFLNGNGLRVVPTRKIDRPSPERLNIRFQEFSAQS